MPLYEDENTTRAKLFELRKRNRCQVCRGALDVFLDLERHKAFLACGDWPRTHHEGIEREAQPFFEPNIPTRREEMEEELGKEKATKLEKYEGVVSLTRAQAMYVLQTIWPDAPEVEVIKAAMICAQYGFNPLMRHIFLIPFKKRNKKGEVIGVEWAIVRGIGADRLLAQRRHHFSYLDLSPRRMTEEEQTKVRGEVDDSKIWAITKIKDMDTGAEAMGIGSWPADEEPYGVEKGNSKLNMACIHSERQALDRQYPGEMPQGVGVIDEKYIEADYTLLAEGDGEKGVPRGGKGEESPAFSPSMKQETTKNGASAELGQEPSARVAGEGFSIDLTWLDQVLKEIKWSHQTLKDWIKSTWKDVDTRGELSEVIPRLTRDQAEQVVKELQRRAADKQMGLFE